MCAGLLLPLAGLRAEYQRAASAALLIGAWGWLLAGLVPGGDAKDAAERFDSPVRIVALVVAVVVGVLVAAWLVRVVVRNPTVWFVLLGIALPIRTPVTIGSQEANLLVPLYAVIVLGLIAWVWGRARGHIATPALEGPWMLTVPLAAFTAYVLVSTLWSADTSEAAIKASCFFIPFVLLYALVVAWWSRARALAALAVVTVAGGVIAALVALDQYATKDIWWNATLQQANVYSRFFRVNGIFFDPNILGRYLAVAIMVCLALAWVRRSRIELIGLATAVVLMTAGLAVTFSRSSALMLMLGVALLAGRAIGAWRAALTGLVLLLVAGGLATATSGNVRHALTNQNRLERVSEGRFDLMKGGLEIWRDDPVVRRRPRRLRAALRGDAHAHRAAARARGDLPQQPDHRAQRGGRRGVRALRPAADRGRMGDRAGLEVPGRRGLGAVDDRRRSSRGSPSTACCTRPCSRTRSCGSASAPPWRWPRWRRRRPPRRRRRRCPRRRPRRREGPLPHEHVAGAGRPRLRRLRGGHVRRPDPARHGGGPGRDRPPRPRPGADPRQVRLADRRAVRHARRADVIYAHYLFPTGAAADLGRPVGRHPVRRHRPRAGRAQPARPSVRRATAGPLRRARRHRREPPRGRGAPRLRAGGAAAGGGEHGRQPRPVRPGRPRRRAGAPGPAIGRRAGGRRRRADRAQEPAGAAPGLRAGAGRAPRHPAGVRRRRPAARAVDAGHGRLGLGAAVLLTGALPHAAVADWVGRVDALAIVSRVEPLGVAALEALAGGRPVVATGVGGTREVVPDPEARDGSWTPRDPWAIADAILEVLADPPRARGVPSRRGAQRHRRPGREGGRDPRRAAAGRRAAAFPRRARGGAPALRCAADADDPSPAAGRGPRAARARPSSRRPWDVLLGAARRVAAARGRRAGAIGADGTLLRDVPIRRLAPVLVILAALAAIGGPNLAAPPAPGRVPVPHPDRGDRVGAVGYLLMDGRLALPAALPRPAGLLGVWILWSALSICWSDGHARGGPLDKLPGDDVRPRDRDRPDLPQRRPGARSCCGRCSGRSRSPASWRWRRC